MRLKETQRESRCKNSGEIWSKCSHIKFNSRQKKRKRKRQERRMGKLHTAPESVVLITVVQGRKKRKKEGGGPGGQQMRNTHTWQEKLRSSVEVSCTCKSAHNIWYPDIQLFMNQETSKLVSSVWHMPALSPLLYLNFSLSLAYIHTHRHTHTHARCG